MHGLSLFPQILFLAPLSTSMLRVAAAIVFFSIAYVHFQKRHELSHVEFILIGRGLWIPTLAGIVEFAIGAGLLLGMYTQIIAILGALGALKSFVWKGRYNSFIPISRTASALLFVICLSLIFTGPGAFAFDLPL